MDKISLWYTANRVIETVSNKLTGAFLCVSTTVRAFIPGDSVKNRNEIARLYMAQKICSASSEKALIN